MLVCDLIQISWQMNTMASLEKINIITLGHVVETDVDCSWSKRWNFGER